MINGQSIARRRLTNYQITRSPNHASQPHLRSASANAVRRPLVFCRALLLVIAALLAAVATNSAQTRDDPDIDAIARIKQEAQRSQLVETIGYLTDVYGPRLTGSPHLRAAADYVVARLTGWGLQNVKFERWGPFGPGWTNDRFSALALAPQAYPLIAYPKPWTPGTTGDLV